MLEVIDKCNLGVVMFVMYTIVDIFSQMERERAIGTEEAEKVDPQAGGHSPLTLAERGEGGWLKSHGRILTESDCITFSVQRLAETGLFWKGALQATHRLIKIEAIGCLLEPVEQA
jgi:hypothetical protein